MGEEITDIYNHVFILPGGDDIGQLCEAGEEITDIYNHFFCLFPGGDNYIPSASRQG